MRQYLIMLTMGVAVTFVIALVIYLYWPNHQQKAAIATPIKDTITFDTLHSRLPRLDTID